MSTKKTLESADRHLAGLRYFLAVAISRERLTRRQLDMIIAKLEAALADLKGLKR